MIGYRPPMQMPIQAPVQNKIIRRPISEMEKQFAIGAFKNFQKTMVGPGIFAIVLLILNLFIFPSLGAPFEVLIIFQIFAIGFGIAALGASVNVILVRKKVQEALREGTAIEVQGPAYKNRANKNIMTWQVGPISIMSNRRGLDQMIVEGAPTSVLFVPKLKSAISINNMALRQNVRVTSPPNIDVMATPAAQGIQLPMQPAAPAFPKYYPQQLQQYPPYNPKMPYK